MLKTKDATLLSSFKEYAGHTGENKDRVIRAFKRRIYLDDLNAYLRSKAAQVIDVGVGSLDAKIMIVLQEKDLKQIAFYRDWMLAKGIKISDVYVTYLVKGTEGHIEDYKEVLQKEASLFAKDSIIINHTTENLPGYVKSINNAEFEVILTLSAKEARTPEEDRILLELKKTYWMTVREMLNYKIF